jgi:predicted dehydrogenase
VEIETPLERQRALTVAVFGEGPEAGRWLRALRGVEGLTALRAGAGEDELMSALARDDVEAVVFAGEEGDPAAAARRALMANRHVLIAGPTAMSTKQLTALDTLARRRNRVLAIDNGAMGDERIDFVRKMVAGPQALWRPRYVRSLRTGADGRSLDALAIADIYLVLALLSGTPSRVGAVSPRIDDETGAADVAMLTLAFDGGSSARIDVSLIEPEARHEVVIACDGRTLVLDAFNARAPLQIQASARHRGPRHGEWGETVSEHPSAEPVERLACAAGAFAAAVCARDAAASNAREVAAAARVWEAARTSIARGGEMVEIGGGAAEDARPRLKLIVGGGHVDASYPAPELTVVARRPARMGPHEPLESA